MRRLAPWTVVIGLAVLAGGVAVPDAHAQGTLLPDLDQELPDELQVAASGRGADRSFWLGFSSAVSNIGDGPLVINGHRPNRRSKAMVADQLIAREGLPPAVAPRVARLRYVRSPDHNHWHVLKFERYKLRRAGRKGAVVRDRKSGFCLGDRYEVDGPALSGSPEEPVYTSRCGLGQRQLLGLTEGISVGYGDRYSPYLEYQQLPLDGLRPGRYVLKHRVNVRRRLRETSLANNSASVLLSVRWRHGRPRLRLLRSCPDSGRCDDPGAGSSETASRPDRLPTRSRRAALAASADPFLCNLP